MHEIICSNDFFGAFIPFAVTMDDFFSDSDTETVSFDDDRDPDYVPSCDNSESTTDIDEILHDTTSNASQPSNLYAVQNSNETEFVSDLSLSPILKIKSNADVELWKRFGYLMKAGVLVNGLSDRYYYSLCLC